MKPASERRDAAGQFEELGRAADELGVPDETVRVARELYLLSLPVPERSETAVLAASCYTAGLVTGAERAQSAVADAFDVSRLAIQSRWRDQLDLLGLSPPEW